MPEMVQPQSYSYYHAMHVLNERRLVHKTTLNTRQQEKPSPTIISFTNRHVNPYRILPLYDIDE